MSISLKLFNVNYRVQSVYLVVFFLFPEQKLLLYNECSFFCVYLLTYCLSISLLESFNMFVLSVTAFLPPHRAPFRHPPTFFLYNQDFTWTQYFSLLFYTFLTYLVYSLTHTDVYVCVCVRLFCVI